MFFDFSEEGDVPCLGLIPGKIRIFPQRLKEEGFKIPHMGWNDISLAGNVPLFEGIEYGSSFYFVHSYYMSPDDEADIAAWCGNS